MHRLLAVNQIVLEIYAAFDMNSESAELIVDRLIHLTFLRAFQYENRQLPSLREMHRSFLIFLAQIGQ